MKRRKGWILSCDVGKATEWLELILQPFRRFTYVTAHSPTLPLLHLCHSSFSKPFFRFSYSQVLHLCHLASRPCLLSRKMSFFHHFVLQIHFSIWSSWSCGLSVPEVSPKTGFGNLKGSLLLSWDWGAGCLSPVKNFKLIEFLLSNDGQVLQLRSETVAVPSWMNMVWMDEIWRPYDTWGRIWPTLPLICLSLEKTPPNNLNQEIDSTGDQTSHHSRIPKMQ